MEDAMGVIRNFISCPYEKTVKPAEGIEVRFVDAGHLLGSASIEITITEGDTKKKIVFSGDIGNTNQPLIKDPTWLHEADYVVMESTYGDRSHGDRPDYVGLLSEVIQRTFDRGGNLVIPSFAVGRTQEMLYFIRQIKEEGRDVYKRQDQYNSGSYYDRSLDSPEISPSRIQYHYGVYSGSAAVVLHI